MSQLSGDGGTGTVMPAVRAELIRTLYRQRIWIQAANPFNAAVVAAVLWPWADGRLIVAWVLASVIVTVLRGLLRARYLRAEPPAAAAQLWGRRFAVLAGVAGSLWGVGSVLFYDPHTQVVQLILVFTIGGMIAGAAANLAYYPPAFVAYTGAAMLPLAARVLVEGDRLHLGMGLLLLVFAMVLTTVAINSNRAVTEAFRLRFDNDQLLGRLRAAQSSLEDANRTLEQRVAERGAEIEKQAEALRDARRMESLGLLAGGVAHDFNNLLTVIIGNAHVVLGGETLSADDRACVEEIRSAASRAGSLVSQLLTFSRRQVMERRVLDLNAVVGDMQRLLARLIGENIELAVGTEPGTLPIRADPVQLEQVIVNLATNARDAMRAGGKLTIETRGEEITPQGPRPGGIVAPGSYVVLSVGDTGTGMDQETRRLAFHPFFTTKEVGEGTGLGLATVYGIVEQSGGHVLVESELGKGSCFRVYLPRTAEPLATDAPAASRPAPLPRKPGTVLLAEDEAMVRAVTARALGNAGFTVMEAEDGEQALRLAEAHQAPIELLVTDVVMKKMGGIELAKQLAPARPGLRVLFLSGYSWNAEVPPSDVTRGIDFLRKPFTPDVLVERVARLLAGAPAQTPQPDSPAGGPRSPVAS